MTNYEQLITLRWHFVEQRNTIKHGGCISRGWLEGANSSLSMTKQITLDFPEDLNLINKCIQDFYGICTVLETYRMWKCVLKTQRTIEGGVFLCVDLIFRIFLHRPQNRCFPSFIWWFTGNDFLLLCFPLHDLTFLLSCHGQFQ